MFFCGYIYSVFFDICSEMKLLSYNLGMLQLQEKNAKLLNSTCAIFIRAPAMGQFQSYHVLAKTWFQQFWWVCNSILSYFQFAFLYWFSAVALTNYYTINSFKKQSDMVSLGLNQGISCIPFRSISFCFFAFSKFQRLSRFLTPDPFLPLQGKSNFALSTRFLQHIPCSPAHHNHLEVLCFLLGLFTFSLN